MTQTTTTAVSRLACIAAWLSLAPVAAAPPSDPSTQASPAARRDASLPMPRDPPLNPERVGWTALRLTGSKLFVSADTRLAIATLPGAGVTAGLRTPPTGVPVPAGNRVLEVSYEGTALGRTSRATLLMDPGTGAAIQRSQEDTGGRLRQRVYRYTDQGAYHWTRRPASGEASLPPARWTRVDEGPRPYGEPARGAVLEPTGLVYAVAAAPLLAPGDSRDFRVFQRRMLVAVEVVVAGRQRLDVDYVDETGGGRVRRRGSVAALHLQLRGDPDLAGSEDELELLGLRGDLELWLDPATRAPLQLAGAAPVLGRVTLRLKALTRATPLPAATGGT